MKIIKYYKKINEKDRKTINILFPWINISIKDIDFQKYIKTKTQNKRCDSRLGLDNNAGNKERNIELRLKRTVENIKKTGLKDKSKIN